jgi:hypothetical protein
MALRYDRRAKSWPKKSSRYGRTLRTQQFGSVTPCWKPQDFLSATFRGQWDNSITDVAVLVVSDISQGSCHCSIYTITCRSRCTDASFTLVVSTSMSLLVLSATFYVSLAVSTPEHDRAESHHTTMLGRHARRSGFWSSHLMLRCLHRMIGCSGLACSAIWPPRKCSGYSASP